MRPGKLVVPAHSYVAGLFDDVGPDGPKSALIATADWLQLRVVTRATSEAASERECDFALHGLVLDLKRGLVVAEFRRADDALPTMVLRTLHLVSGRTRALGLQLAELRIGDGPDPTTVTLEASLGDRGLGLVPQSLEERTEIWRTKYGGKQLTIAVSSRLSIAGEPVSVAESGALSSSWTWTGSSHAPAFLERTVAMEVAEPGAVAERTGAQRIIEQAANAGWPLVLAEHEAAWAERWRASDVVVGSDPSAQRALRFAIYHLNSAADPTNDRVSIGARALTGDDYHGHVFWDTEIYLLPFYTLTWPEAARALLAYRFHTLDGARAKAARMGWRGALYAWESAGTGDETTPENVVGPDRHVVAVLSGSREQHISADVAYAVWQYWEATRDDVFMASAGAEMLIEIARFWASRALPEADGKRHIRGVMGPDEYHEDVDDNAFTNGMARFALLRACDAAEIVRSRSPERWTELSQRLAIDPGEVAAWADAAAKLETGFDPASGLREQFAGYFLLEDIELRNYAGRSVPMDVVLGRDRTSRSQIVKQADVVALVALLPEEFTEDAARANFAYYERRCSHGSSLSRAMHALVAARLGDCYLAQRYFEETAAIDLDDSHAAIGGGVHIAAQGGLWLVAVFGFSGLTLRDYGLQFEPNIPAAWGSLRYRVCWRGRVVAIAIDGSSRELRAILEAGEPMEIAIDGTRHELDRTSELLVRYAARTPGKIGDFNDTRARQPALGLPA